MRFFEDYRQAIVEGVARCFGHNDVLFCPKVNWRIIAYFAICQISFCRALYPGRKGMENTGNPKIVAFSHLTYIQF